MAMKISFRGARTMTVRTGGPGGVDVEMGPGGMRVVIGDSDSRDDRVAGPRGRDGREDAVRSRQGRGQVVVTPEMEAAATRAFLAGADVARLGRSLADVYRAMDEVRWMQNRRCGSDED